MARSRVKLDSRQVRRILTSDRTEAELAREGERILTYAKEHAPVVSGAYRDSLKLVHDITDRSVVRVVADIDYGLAVEAKDAVLGVALNMAHKG